MSSDSTDLDSIIYHSDSVSIASARCEGQCLESPPSLDPSFLACDLFGGGAVTLIKQLSFTDNQDRQPSSLEDPIFSPPDRPAGKQFPISYNRNIQISSENYHWTTPSSEHKLLIMPACTTTRQKKPGASVLQVYSHWIKSSSIRITNTLDAANGACLAVVRISAAQFVRAYDKDLTQGRTIPAIKIPNYAQEIRIEQLVGFERPYHDLQLHRIPDNISNANKSDDGFNVISYDVAGVNNDERIVTHNAILIKTEIYARKAKGVIELSIQAPEDMVAHCWDPPS